LLVAHDHVLARSSVWDQLRNDAFDQFTRRMRPKRNDPHVRPAYLVVSGDGNLRVAFDPASNWARNLAARQILERLDDTERLRLFTELSHVAIPTPQGPAALWAPAKTAAVLSVNVVPLIPQDGQVLAVFPFRSARLADYPLAIGTIGGSVDPDDVADGAWDPLTTLRRECHEEIGNAIDSMTVVGAAFGVLKDGQFPVTTVVRAQETTYDDLPRGRAPSSHGVYELAGFLAVPATLDGLTAALCTPTGSPHPIRGTDYNPYPWTPWAVGAADLVAAAVLSRPERLELRRRTATVASMAQAYGDLCRREPELAWSTRMQLPPPSQHLLRLAPRG
jgi:hypothetical protein